MRRACYLLHLALCLLLPASCDWRGDHYERLLADAEEMNRHDSLFTSDSLGLALVRHYDHWWHSRNHRLRAYYMLGCAYRDMNNAPRALENYQRAAEMGEGHTDSATLDQLMRIHSQMSEIFLRQRLPELEKAELTESERLAWKLKDTLSALILHEYICNILYNEQRYTECIEKSTELYKNYLQNGYEANAQLATSLCIKSHLALGNYVEAKSYIDIYESCAFFNSAPHKISGGISSLYNIKGEYYLGVEEADSAESYFRKVLTYRNQGNNELLAAKGLYKTYAMLHQADSALHYMQLYSEAKEKSYDEGIAEATIQAEKLYDYSVEKETAERKAAEASRLRNVIVFLTIAALLVVFFFLYRNEKRKREISDLHRQYLQVVNNLRSNEQALLALRQQQATESEQAAILIHENEQLKEQLRNINISLQSKDSHAKSLSLQESDIVRHFQRYRTTVSPELEIQEEHWIRLRRTIDSTHPLFYTRMNALQNLSENEYRVCMLVLAGFEPSDIDMLMDKKHTYATNMRKRLHLKVFGTEGSATDFDAKIRNL